MHQLIFVFIALWTFVLARLGYDEWQQHLRHGRKGRWRLRRRRIRP